MATERRIARIESRIRQEVAELFIRDLKDPRMKGLVSITRVKVARDLGHARVFYTVLGSERDKRTVSRFIESARKFVQAHVASRLDLRGAPIVEFTYDYYVAHEYFVQIVVAENQAQGRHMKRSATLRRLNQTIVQRLAAVIARGRAEGVFRPDIEAVDVHMTIAALGMFNVTNQHTFGALFRHDMGGKGDVARRRLMAADIVQRWLAPTPAQPH